MHSYLLVRNVFYFILTMYVFASACVLYAYSDQPNAPFEFVVLLTLFFPIIWLVRGLKYKYDLK